MARFQRLIAAFLLLVSVGAYASFPATSTGGTSCPGGAASCVKHNAWAIGGGYSPQEYDTPQLACNETLSVMNAGNSSTYFEISNVASNLCYLKCYLKSTSASCGGDNYGTNAHTVSATPGTYSCPSNSKLSGSSCTCNSGYTESGSSCVVADVNNCPKAGTTAGNWSHPMVAGKSLSDPYSVCDGETPAGSSDGALCVVVITGGIAYGNPMMVYGPAVYSGAKSASCNGNGGTGTSPGSGNSTPPVQGEPAPTPCKIGEAPGTVNGITKCYKAGDTGQPVKTETKTDSSTSVDGNTPTSSGTSSSTVCQALRCETTTTTTKTDSSGNTTTSSSTKSESKDDYCASNPRSAQCITSSYGGGACGTEPTCDGDAIQCAVASFTFKTQCALTTAPTDNADLEKYKTEAAKNQGDQTISITKEVSIGSSSFDQSDVLGGHGVLQDQVVTIAGQSVTIPWSSGNVWLERLGMVMQACTFLLCARIVMRG